MDPLLGALSQCSDHDVERKLYRTYHLILRDIFLNKHVFLQPQFASFTVDIRKGIASKSLIRSGLCWKSFGIFCNPKYRDYNSTLQSNEIFDAIIAQKEFKKQPKTLFSNASTEGDVTTSLYFSSCLASSAFHSQDVPPLTCMQNISLWCSSSYLPLARNALKLVARMTSLHPIESSSFLLTLLSSPPETVKTDALSFTLLMKAVTSLAMPIFSRLHSAEVETVYTDIMYQICTLLQTKNKYFYSFFFMVFLFRDRG